MTTEFRDVFRTNLGTDPALSAPFMNHTHVWVKVRRYSRPKAAFLRSKVDEIRRLWFVWRNNSSQRACAALVVPKQGPELFRFSVDLRSVNSETMSECWPMPDLDLASSKLAGSTCYGVIYPCHGYWQLALDEDLQECQSLLLRTDVLLLLGSCMGRITQYQFSRPAFKSCALRFGATICSGLTIFSCKFT